MKKIFINKLLIRCKEILKKFLIKLVRIVFKLNFKNQLLKSLEKIVFFNSKKEVDIIIPVFNSHYYVEKCLESILISKSDYFINLIIVDDCSNSETKNVLKNYSQNNKINIKIITNKNNLGYTKSVNRGIKKSSAKYIIIANSDILVVDYWIERLVRSTLLNKNVGIVGPLTNAGSFQSIPKVKNKNGTLAINTIPNGLSYGDLDRLVEKYSLNIKPNINIINGFCHLITRDCLNKVGFLDEENFPRGYGEEVDFCLRTLKKGFKILVADNLYIYHHKTKSFTKNEREKLIKNNFKNLFQKYTKEELDRHILSMERNIYLHAIRERIIDKIYKAKK